MARTGRRDRARHWQPTISYAFRAVALLPLLTIVVPGHAAARQGDGNNTIRILPATSAIRVDGVLDEDAWSRAAAIPLPFEIYPGDNVPALVATDCRLAFDEENLYFGCRAEDPDASSIRTYLTDRDDVDEQDRIGILLDPFRDSRRGFAFVVTASGVQSDYVSGATEDGAAWDAIWEAETTQNADGYVIEAAIPFKSLRFPAGQGVQSWNFHFWRERPRGVARSFRSGRLDQSNLCELCQLSTFTGLTGIEPGTNIELTPTLTSQRADRRPAADTPSLVSGDIEPEVGLDLRWSVTPGVAVNATLNPDFNQVEADAAQVVSNQQFALFYPERRPFFLEGADLFETPLSTVFTRTLSDPSLGVKLSGKREGWAVGALVARDSRTNYLFPGSLASSTGTTEDNATTVVARVRRDIGESHTVGGLVTAREGDGYHNRVASLDTRLHLVGPLNFTGQIARSETDYTDDIVAVHGQPDGTFGGTASFGRFDLDSRNWFGWLKGDLIDAGYRSDAGFVPGVDQRGMEWRIERKWWPAEGSFFNRLRFMFGSGRREERSGSPLYRFIFLSTGFHGGMQSELSFNPDYFTRHFEGKRFHIARLNIFGEVQPIGDAELGFFGQFGEDLDYANAREAGLLRLSPRLDLRLGRHIDLRLNYSFHRLTHEGDAISTEQIADARGIYYFSRRTYLRAVVQLRDIDRDPSLYRDPVPAGNTSLATQFLFSYKLNPQSVVLVGYSDESIDDSTFAATVPDGLRRMSRAFFLKLSYAWRP